MDVEVKLIAEPEELIAWADTYDILLNPSIEDAVILLNYMEGHDYVIGIDEEGKMYRQDMQKRMERLKHTRLMMSLIRYVNGTMT